MGLTNESVGMHAVDSGLMIKNRRRRTGDRHCGNPNVGKARFSTI